jgi:hypothetical protein
MIVDQLLDPVMRDQKVPPPEESQQGAPRHRKNIVPLQTTPDGLQLQHAPQRGISGIIGAVQGADAGADHHIRRNSVGGERMHHAHLNSPEAASAGENKRRFRKTCSIKSRPIKSRQSSNAPLIKHRQPGRVTFEGVIAAGKRTARSRKGWEAVSGAQSEIVIPHGSTHRTSDMQWHILVRCLPASRLAFSARRTPSRSQNGRARCRCLRESRAPRTSGAVPPACPGCRTS